MKDQPEVYIPLPPGRRGSDILRKFFEDPTPEQQAAARRWNEEHEARLRAETAQLRERHQHLIATHAHAIIAQLLREHAPVDLEHEGHAYTTCNTCGDDAVTWPCPTWATISDNSRK